MKYKILNKFTKEHVLNKKLIIQMLQYEDSYGRNQGQQIHEIYDEHTLNPSDAITRHVLLHFNFDSCDGNVNMYKTIFRTYFHSAKDYDEEVINSVYYMKNNKCVYYTEPKMNIGDVIKNCSLLTLECNNITLFKSIDNIKPFNHLFLCAFSMS